jgi:hypothetical protein
MPPARLYWRHTVPDTVVTLWYGPVNYDGTREFDMRFFTEAGFNGALRIGHAMAAFMWMGMLWFFNFVQVPAYAEMEAGARNNAFDKLTWRALWWFRHGAWMTIVTGLAILAIDGPDGVLYDGDYFKSPGGMVLAAAILFAFVMLYNVWMVIWPNQQIVIANARAVQEGKEANPDAPPAARKAAMASRQNMIFSFFVVPAMIGGGSTGVFFVSGFEPPGGGVRILFWLLTLAVAVGMELNALGVVGGRDPGGTNVIYDTHKNAMYAGLLLLGVIWLYFEFIVGTL